jgi:hypothetical protein
MPEIASQLVSSRLKLLAMAATRGEQPGACQRLDDHLAPEPGKWPRFVHRAIDGLAIRTFCAEGREAEEEGCRVVWQGMADRFEPAVPGVAWGEDGRQACVSGRMEVHLFFCDLLKVDRLPLRSYAGKFGCPGAGSRFVEDEDSAGIERDPERATLAGVLHIEVDAEVVVVGSDAIEVKVSAAGRAAFEEV